MLESDMAHAFLTPSNKDMTPTDAQKNTVYYIAKQVGQLHEPCAWAAAVAAQLNRSGWGACVAVINHFML